MGAYTGSMLGIVGDDDGFCRCRPSSSPEEKQATVKHWEQWDAYIRGEHSWDLRTEALMTGLGARSSPGIASMKTDALCQWAAPGVPSLTTIVECHQPLLFEIAGYLSESPSDFVTFGSLSAKLVMTQMEVIADSLWGSMYARRWSAFHECMNYLGAKDWRGLYRDTLAGRCECTLEVFDREKKLGFAMAAMAARTQYEASLDAYVVRYLSASEVLPEKIPAAEGHRLRFCPPSCRDRLQPGFPTAAAQSDARVENALPESTPKGAYPYRVLEGIEDLKVGQGVELQWKMQYGSPFGWWFGTVEAIRTNSDAKTATITIAFKHFPTTSRWYRLEVQFGDAEMRPCTFGGYTGGIRAASESEVCKWMRFFPKEPVVF